MSNEPIRPDDENAVEKLIEKAEQLRAGQDK